MIKQHFLYTEHTSLNGKYLKIYENKGKGNVVYLGELKTVKDLGSHKYQAWHWIVKTNLLMKSIHKALKAEAENELAGRDYFSIYHGNDTMKDFGLRLEPL